VAFTALATPGVACAPDVGLGQIRAHLFYKNSATLSDDLLAREDPFIGWNSIIGEGDAAEPAEDLLIVVTVEGKGEEYVAMPLEVWVTDEADGEIARRRFEGLLIPASGSVGNPLWIDDAGCAGIITIHARFNGEEKAATLQLACGE
jgi:hypothetical protein